MLIKGGYLHSLKALLEKARKTPEPSPTPPVAEKKKSSSATNHGKVSPATVRNIANKE